MVRNRKKLTTEVLSPKSLRWMDLVTVLLARRQPATRDEIYLEIAAYGMELRLAASDAGNAARRASESVRRKFERDKDDLRARGLIIDTVRFAGGGNMAGQVGYVLRPSAERPVSLGVLGPGDGRPAPGKWQVTEDEIGLVDACLARLAVLRSHPLQTAAESARRAINPGADDPELGGGEAPRLTPRELLAVQVALAIDSRGAWIGARLAGTEADLRD